jgi:hypothetical protein
MSISMKSWLLAGVIAAMVSAASVAQAQPASLKISEVYINPAGSGDTEDTREYVEITGSDDLSTDSDYDYYFVALECEGANAGIVDTVFVIDENFASDGIRWYAPHTSGHEFGGGNADGGITDPASNDAIENSGATYMIIAVDVAAASGDVPLAGDDYDASAGGVAIIGNQFNNGAWEILDSVGAVAEVDDVCTATVYAPINFYAGNDWQEESVVVPADAEAVPTNHQADGCYGGQSEIEFIARCGNQSGAWYAAGVTHGGSSPNRTLVIDSNPSSDPKVITQEISDEEIVPFAPSAAVQSPGTTNVNCGDECGC